MIAATGCQWTTRVAIAALAWLGACGAALAHANGRSYLHIGAARSCLAAPRSSGSP